MGVGECLLGLEFVGSLAVHRIFARFVDVSCVSRPVDWKKSLTAEQLFCSACNLNFTSGIHAEQHYQGRNHARKVAGLDPLKTGYFNKKLGKWQRHPPDPTELTANMLIMDSRISGNRL